MFIAGFPSAMFGTNCYVVATAPGEQCVVVDPGIEVVGQLEELLAEHRLQPVAVMLTHGHIDHTYSVAPVCGARGIPAWIHPEDRELLVDPGKGMGMSTQALFGGRLEWTEPDDVRLLDDDAPIELAGLSFTVDHAPGHTPGSVMFRLPKVGDVGEQILISGDVLFQGSIGRMDLPGGNEEQMYESLRSKVLPLDDGTIVLPGHGDQTTIGIERATNPYLDMVARPAAPHRGM
ncbi:MBL fold metallo-hydrolase [Sporichthya sp.]|uniref:MBL fold metallo-hydrolase n=1 Tax=Sporichthya sp. TaxID=65475 RepID=UPI001849A7AC|nr:MBL fold metallo-hydrolase [Sporichthya sp.]MBA3742947.1 MBL fold metallo-hydrolase [Sporichthya sp.]